MREVRFDLLGSTGRSLHVVGGVCEAEPAGSLTGHAGGGRQVYLFGWLLGEGPGVWRSKTGIDEANSAVRVVTTTGFDRLAALDEGPFELQLRPGVRLRFYVTEE